MTELEDEIVVLADLEPAQRAAVHELVDAATAVDGVEPVNEQTMLRVRYGGTGIWHTLVLSGQNGYAGYGLLDLSRDDVASAEAVVHPRHRRQHTGTALVRRLRGEAGPRPLRIWAHGDLPGAAALAHRLRFARVRELWQMRRPLAEPLPDVSIPDGVSVRTFQPGADEEAWLAVNARAFADHAEQGAMTRADLEEREKEPWFDPAGFFLAEHHGGLAGFHWTKVHAGHDRRVGEVYVVGIDPAAQGLGLGGLLTLVGLHHLRARDVEEVVLFVEADNAAAIRVYEKLGFAHARTDVMYESRVE